MSVQGPQNSSSEDSARPPGWYRLPWSVEFDGYWDGAHWTGQVVKSATDEERRRRARRKATTRFQTSLSWVIALVLGAAALVTIYVGILAVTCTKTQSACYQLAGHRVTNVAWISGSIVAVLVVWKLVALLARRLSR